MKILVIDDSLMDRKVNINIIKKSGFDNEILQAVNGEEGWKILVEEFENIGVILLDWQMPIMDGLAFLKVAAQSENISNIPIIMITASGAEENKQVVYATYPNIAGYLVKSYKAVELSDILSTLLK